MIRILTSLVAVLTVTSIQSQTSLSQLSKILSEGSIDKLSGTYIDEIFRHSLSLHYNTELYNGGFIASSYEGDSDVFFAKNPFLFLLKKEQNSTSSFVVNKENRLDSYLSARFVTDLNSNTIQSFLYSNKEIIKSEVFNRPILSKNISNDQYSKYLISEYLDIDNTNPLFHIQDIGFNTTSSFITYHVSTVQRIRSPGSIFFS